MSKKVEVWEALDGTLCRTKKEAEAHDITGGLKEWYYDDGNMLFIQDTDGTYREVPFENVQEWLFQHSFKIRSFLEEHDE